MRTCDRVSCSNSKARKRIFGILPMSCALKIFFMSFLLLFFWELSVSGIASNRNTRE